MRVEHTQIRQKRYFTLMGGMLAKNEWISCFCVQGTGYTQRSCICHGIRSTRIWPRFKVVLQQNSTYMRLRGRHLSFDLHLYNIFTSLTILTDLLCYPN